MTSFIWRVIIAVICVAAIFALMPPVLRIFELAASNDVITVIKVCVGVLALLYIVKGPDPPFSKTA